MIPASLFHAKLPGIPEIRALDFAPDCFTFRLAKRENPKSGAVTAHFYHPERAEWTAVSCTCRIRKLSGAAYWNEFRCEIADELFQREARSLSRTILSYVSLREEEDSEGIAKLLSSWSGDGESAPSIREKERRWLCGMENFSLPEGMALGILLSSPPLWEAFLRLGRDAFGERYLAAFLPGRGGSFPALSYLYLGNPFCVQLVPGEEEMERILQKALAENLTPVVTLPPMREEVTDLLAERLRFLQHFCERAGRSVEVECNDIGEADLIREEKDDLLVPTAGVLLARRRKDPRQFSLPSFAASHVAASTVNDPVFLEQFPTSRTALETCGVVPLLPGRGTLYGPYYEMSVSLLCPLLAAESGSRGAQKRIAGCPMDCLHNAFLYPDAEHMAGIGNAILGFSESAFSGAMLKDLAEAGCDRFVLNFPGGCL